MSLELLIWSIEICNFFSMFLIFIDLAFCLALLIHFTLILLTSQLCQCINLSVIYFQLGKFLWKSTAPCRIIIPNLKSITPNAAILPSYLPFSNLAIKIFGFGLQLQSTGFFPKLRFLENSAQNICWVDSFRAWFAKEYICILPWKIGFD